MTPEQSDTIRKVAKPQRPMPAGFAEDACKLTWGELQRKYRAGCGSIRRWIEEAGISRAPVDPYPVPADFHEKATQLTRKELAAHYAAGIKMVYRWIRNTGVEPPIRREQVSTQRPVPEDFAQVAPTMMFSQIVKHYRVGDAALHRWIRETGVKPAPPVRTRKSPRRPYAIRNHPVAAMYVRNYTSHDEAADILRRERFPVYRCGKTGKYDPKGTFWRVGITVVTPDELLVRADKYRRKAA